MANSFVYSVGGVALLIASIVVAQSGDPVNQCLGVFPLKPDVESCIRCVETHINASSTKNCTFLTTAGGAQCVNVTQPPAEEAGKPLTNVTECTNDLPPANGTTTTTPATTTTSTSTTTAPTTTSATTTIPTTQPPSTTKPTIPTTPTTAPTTPTPSNTTTVAPSPTPAPRSGGGMSFASFFAGIVFTLCMSGLGYLIWRFYKARMDRNYHTFSNPTF